MKRIMLLGLIPLVLIVFINLQSCGSAGGMLAGAVGGAVDVSGSIDISGMIAAGGMVKGAMNSFSAIARFSGGLEMKATSSEEVPQRIMEIIEQAMGSGNPVDLAFVVDTTGSMGDHIAEVRNTLSEIVDKLSNTTTDWQAAFVAYRDLEDDYVSRVATAFTTDTASLQEGIASLEANGGGDFCEHVYAGLYQALTDLSWREGTDHHLILIGDAPAHNDYSDPRNRAAVEQLASEKTAMIHTIVITCNAACRALLKLTGSDSCD
jgi:hypothetical protein